MVAPLVEQQLHGYRGGHQLLATSVNLTRADQDLVDRLSDLSGSLAPGQKFDPYLTTYPLPSGNFYVVARTWQDQSATRAGCVLTRSLLVPMAYWLDSPSLPFLLEALHPVDKLNPTVSAIMVISEIRSLPPVKDARTAELVEALFLETRQPIVMFDVDAADSIIARLLAALWPGMRRQFASCGFALGPRSLEGRPFDFICAPKSSRLRFSDWPGRKIDESVILGPRHRWTRPAAEQIFLSPMPNLSSLDTLGVLQSDIHGDHGALRIALLWNELLEKSKTSANAALGLLDILASQKASASASSLLPILSKAVEISHRDNSAFEHLRFLMTLLGKFPSQPMSLSLLRLIRRSAESVSRQDASNALNFLSTADSQRLPRILCAGLADGIAATSTEDSVSAFIDLSPEIRLMLMSASEKLDQWIARLFLSNQSSTWTNAIRIALEFPVSHLQIRAAGHLIPKLNHKNQLPVLQGVLNNAAWPVIERVIEQLWRGCQLRVAEFDNSILSATVHAHAMRNLQNKIRELSESSATDRLLTKTLRLNETDLDWIMTSESLTTSRKMRIISLIILNSDDYDLGRVFSNVELKTDTLKILIGGGVDERLSLSRILVSTNIDSQEEFEIGLEVLDQVGDSFLQHGLARLLLKTLFVHSDWGRRRQAGELVGKLGAQLEAMEIIVDATDQSFSADQLNVNVLLLNIASQSVRTLVLERVDQLCERIINFRKAVLDMSAALALAELIADAGQVSLRAQLRAAELILPFALKLRNGPISPLIIATFPLVHAELAQGNAAPSLFSVLFLGDSWDRSESLRRELVNAFMHSVWPPADLLVAAHAVNVVHEVIDVVSSQYKGTEYQMAIIKDIKRLPKNLQHELLVKMKDTGRNHFPSSK